jgi:hypothetical protein
MMNHLPYALNVSKANVQPSRSLMPRGCPPIHLVQTLLEVVDPDVLK